MTLEEIKNSNIESVQKLVEIAHNLGIEVSPVYKTDDPEVAKEAMKILSERGVSSLYYFIGPAFRHGNPNYVMMDKGSVITEFSDLDFKLLKDLIIKAEENRRKNDTFKKGNKNP